MGEGSALMDRAQFWAAVQVLLDRHIGSQTSCRRTVKHNRQEGGKPDSPHLVGLGEDVVWDVPPTIVDLQREANALGLMVIREDDHDHLQPLDWPHRKAEYLARLLQMEP